MLKSPTARVEIYISIYLPTYLLTYLLTYLTTYLPTYLPTSQFDFKKIKINDRLDLRGLKGN